VYNKLVSVENKIDSPRKSNSARETLVQLEACKVPPPPPNPKPEAKQFKVNSDNLRRDLMDELKDIIKKRQELDPNNNK
jgi:hypothetical protein